MCLLVFICDIYKYCICFAVGPEPLGDDEEPLDYATLAEAIRSHPSTDAEIQTLCKDLQVLGRSEFKQLLRWRMTLRKALKQLLGGGGDGDESSKQGQHKKKKSGNDDGDKSESDDDADPEQKLLDEMASIKEQAEKR